MILYIQIKECVCVYIYDPYLHDIYSTSDIHSCASKGWIAHVGEEGHLRDEHQLLVMINLAMKPKQPSNMVEKQWNIGIWR